MGQVYHCAACAALAARVQELETSFELFRLQYIQDRKRQGAIFSDSMDATRRNWNELIDRVDRLERRPALMGGAFNGN